MNEVDEIIGSFDLAPLRENKKFLCNFILGGLPVEIEINDADNEETKWGCKIRNETLREVRKIIEEFFIET